MTDDDDDDNDDNVLDHRRPRFLRRHFTGLDTTATGLRSVRTNAGTLMQRFDSLMYFASERM